MNNFGDFFECREQTGVPCHCDTNSVAGLSGLSLIPNLSASLNEVEVSSVMLFPFTISKVLAVNQSLEDLSGLAEPKHLIILSSA